jgi:hypothetical protein
MLFQNSFRIVIETKRQPSFSATQLEAHLSAFRDEATKVLLLLAPQRAVLEVGMARKRGVHLISRTFSDIIAACRSLGLPETHELRELIDDFEDFCAESRLIFDEAERVMVVAVGATMSENLELGLYYAPADRAYQQHSFIGLYTRKAVRAVGKLENVISADLVGDKLLVRGSSGPMSPAQEKRIRRAIALCPGHGYDIVTGHTFFLVQDFASTDFRKTSPGGMLGKRYFNIRDELDLPSAAELPEISVLAESLRSHTWE